VRITLVILLGLAGCSSPEFTSTCTAGTVPADSQLAAGRTGATTSILPGGRALTPAGTLLDVGGFPIAIKVLPGDRYVVVSDDAMDDQALRLVDLQAADPLHPVVSEIPYPIGSGGKHTPGMFYGLAVTQDGKKLYVANGGYDPVPDSVMDLSMHYNTVQVFDLVGTPPQLMANDALTLKLSYTAQGNQRVPSGITLSSDETLLYVANQADNTLAIMSLAPGAGYGTELGRAQLPGVGAYDVAVDETTHTAFVSLWGGAGSTDGVVAVDVSNPMMPTPLPGVISTGKAAEAELMIAGKLYVSNTDADTLSIVDAASRTVMTSPVTSSMILGATPNAIAVGDGRIYLANAGENGVVALDASSLALVGEVPAAWYPTAVAVLGDGTLVIASARGLGVGATDTAEPPYAHGTIQVVPRPTDQQLSDGAKTVADNLDRPHALETPLNCPTPENARFPLPMKPGDPSPIEHVFLVVRENKTYDALLADLDAGNGKPSLTMFGEEVTPNAHELAREFVLLDNFYSHAELSVQGHEWTTGCIANDYTEKSWQHSDDYGRGYISAVPWGPPSALSRLATPPAGSIWHHLDVAGIAYHNYGEITNTGDAMIPADAMYPGVFFNTKISDNDKAGYVVGNLNDPTFKLEPFSYMLLPNDHTNGTSPGQQTPQSMIADNDEGTGKLIDGISHSSYWKSSIVFVVEDDPGGTPDHVEAHRSICLVASPWIKRGYKSSTNFDLGSVYHTIETLIKVGPMNLNDGHAAGMYELFNDKPDLTPYNFVPRKTPVAYNSTDAPLADESARIDWSRPDTADMSRIWWKAVHGKDAEPPGPHRYPKVDRDDDD
jgi:DNA-binding beta-propeller fold protein YncE